MKVSEGSGGTFEAPPLGTYAAVCFRLVDLGTQTSEYKGEKKEKKQILVGWEIDEAMSDGRPFSVSKFYTASLAEKANLRHDLENWRGVPFTKEELAGFDVRNVLGKPCLVTLGKADSGRIKVTVVAKLAKGMKAIKQQNPTSYFSFEEYDAKALAALPEGIQKIIKQSPEYAMMNRGTTDAQEMPEDDDVPVDDEELLPF